MRIHHTDVETAHQQIAVYQRLGPEGRMVVMDQMCGDMRAIAISGIATRHPDYTADQARDAYRRLTLGDDLFSRAFPTRILLAP